MILKVTSKRQVTFSKRIMDKYNLRAGDSLVLTETEEGIMIKPHRFNKEMWAPLRAKIALNTPALNLEELRHAAQNSNLRD
jgi:AbrB family looped-hinge helix DNA binding protein